MRLGRIERNGTAEFVVSAQSGSWVRLESLGFEGFDTRAVIELWPYLTDVLHGTTSGDGIDKLSLSSPVVRPGKIVAIGLNYMDHIRETGARKPERPIAFAKYPSSINGPFDDIEVDDRLTKQADYEAELAVVIGRPARRVQASDAPSYIFGYCVANDVSARDQQRIDSQLSRSKSMDTFCPIGPWITTADEIVNSQDLVIRSWVNGEPRQHSTTAEMIFAIADLIEFLSSTMTLEVGDILLTGTPHGVGLGHKPPIFLKPGDIVRCDIEGLGHIENRIVSVYEC